MRHHTKFYLNQSNSCRGIAFHGFQNNGNPPSGVFEKWLQKYTVYHFLDLLNAIPDHPQKEYLWVFII